MIAKACQKLTASRDAKNMADIYTKITSTLIWKKKCM